MEIDKKLNDWAGTTDVEYAHPMFGIAYCFKWLVPKLSYWTISQEVNTRTGASVQTFDYKRSGVVFGETPALSFCLAIEKLIDGGSNEK